MFSSFSDTVISVNVSDMPLQDFHHWCGNGDKVPSTGVAFATSGWFLMPLTHPGEAFSESIQGLRQTLLILTPNHKVVSLGSKPRKRVPQPPDWRRLAAGQERRPDSSLGRNKATFHLRSLLRWSGRNRQVVSNHGCDPPKPWL